MRCMAFTLVQKKEKTNSKPHSADYNCIENEHELGFMPKIDTQPYLTQFSWPAQL